MSFRPEQVRELLIEHTAAALVAVAQPGDTAEHLVYEGDVPVEHRDALARRVDKARRAAEALTKRTVGDADWMRFRSEESELRGRRRRSRQIHNPLRHDDVGRGVSASMSTVGVNSRQRAALYAAVAARLDQPV